VDQLDVVSTSLRHPGVGQTEQRLQYLRSSNADSDPEKLRGAARELEAYFLHVLIREMRKTVPPNPIIYGGKTEEIFQDFLDEEVSKELAMSNQLGLADLICRSLEDQLKQTCKNADK
jgi:flagellar protein FlgJ